MINGSTRNGANVSIDEPELTAAQKKAELLTTRRCQGAMSQQNSSYSNNYSVPQKLVHLVGFRSEVPRSH